MPGVDAKPVDSGLAPHRFKPGPIQECRLQRVIVERLVKPGDGARCAFERSQHISAEHLAARTIGADQIVEHRCTFGGRGKELLRTRRGSQTGRAVAHNRALRASWELRDQTRQSFDESGPLDDRMS